MSGYYDITRYLFLLGLCLSFDASCIYIPHSLLIYTSQLFPSAVPCVRVVVLVQQPPRPLIDMDPNAQASNAVSKYITGTYYH